MLARKLISRNACRPTRSENGVYSFVNDFIALEMKESLLTFHNDNFCKYMHRLDGDLWLNEEKTGKEVEI